MNRKQRRQSGLNIKQENELDNIIAQKKEQIEQRMFYSTLLTANCITALALNSELGLGKVRINRILKRIKSQYECYRSGHLTGADVVDWCEKNEIDYKVNDLIK